MHFDFENIAYFYDDLGFSFYQQLLEDKMNTQKYIVLKCIQTLQLVKNKNIALKIQRIN